MYDLDADQTKIWYVMFVPSCVTVTACLAILLSIALFPKLQTPAMVLIGAQTAAEMLFALSHNLAFPDPPEAGTVACGLQGWLTVFAGETSLMYSALISWYMVSMIKRRRRSDLSFRDLGRYSLCIVLLTGTMASLPFASNHYADLGTRCWIAEGHADRKRIEGTLYRFLCVYSVIWGSNAFICVSYYNIIDYLVQTGILSVKPRSPEVKSKSTGDRAESEPEEEDADSSQNPIRSDDHHRSSGKTQHSDPASTAETASSADKRFTDSSSDLRASAPTTKRGSGGELTRAAQATSSGATAPKTDDSNVRKTIRTFLFYPIICVAVWVPSTVVRVLTAAAPNSTVPLPLTLLAEVLVSTQGFLFALVFFQYRSVRNQWSRFFRHSINSFMRAICCSSSHELHSKVDNSSFRFIKSHLSSDPKRDIEFGATSGTISSAAKTLSGGGGEVGAQEYSTKDSSYWAFSSHAYLSTNETGLAASPAGTPGWGQSSAELARDSEGRNSFSDPTPSTNTSAHLTLPSVQE